LARTNIPFVDKLWIIQCLTGEILRKMVKKSESLKQAVFGDQLVVISTQLRPGEQSESAAVKELVRCVCHLDKSRC